MLAVYFGPRELHTNQIQLKRLARFTSADALLRIFTLSPANIASSIKTTQVDSEGPYLTFSNNSAPFKHASRCFRKKLEKMNNKKAYLRSAYGGGSLCFQLPVGKTNQPSIYPATPIDRLPSIAHIDVPENTKKLLIRYEGCIVVRRCPYSVTLQHEICHSFCCRYKKLDVILPLRDGDVWTNLAT